MNLFTGVLFFNANSYNPEFHIFQAMKTQRGTNEIVSYPTLSIPMTCVTNDTNTSPVNVTFIGENRIREILLALRHKEFNSISISQGSISNIKLLPHNGNNTNPDELKAALASGKDYTIESLNPNEQLVLCNTVVANTFCFSNQFTSEDALSREAFVGRKIVVSHPCSLTCMVKTNVGVTNDNGNYFFRTRREEGRKEILSIAARVTGTNAKLRLEVSDSALEYNRESLKANSSYVASGLLYFYSDKLLGIMASHFALRANELYLHNVSSTVSSYHFATPIGFGSEFEEPEVVINSGVSPVDDLPF